MKFHFILAKKGIIDKYRTTASASTTGGDTPSFKENKQLFTSMERAL
jgi:hypothetical protein